MLWAAPLRADPARAVIELDAGAEGLLDARVTRRLVALELGDVVVLPAQDQSDTALFYRVLSDGDGRVRIELWERGELHGVRVVSAADGGRHLGARRVALAAAELARRLGTHRVRAQRAAAREEVRAARAERTKRERTLNGPVGLRSGLGVELFTDEGDFLYGPSLALELSVAPLGRVDLGLGLRGGELALTGRSLTALELGLGFSRRLALTRRFDLDLGLSARAGLVSVSGAREVDAVPGETRSWWVRALGAVRAQPRLARELRLDLGALAGPVLREVPVRTAAGDADRVGGFFVGLELGLVVTPDSGR